MAGFKYLPSFANVLYGAGVSGTAAATDFEQAWLCDGRNRPLWITGGTCALTATPLTAGPVDTVVLHSHTVDGGSTVTHGGGVSGSVVVPSYQGGIPYDTWCEVTLAAAPSTITLAISGNSRALVLAELLAGQRVELANDIPRGALSWGYVDKTLRRQSQRGSVPNYPRGIAQRWMKGKVLVSADERDAIQDWYLGSYEDSRPSVVLPMHDVPDAWVVGWSAPPSFELHDASIDGLAGWDATLEFEEWERKRWIPVT